MEDDEAEAADGDETETGNGNGAAPEHGIPPHANWIPANSRDPEATGVYYTHLDWESTQALDDDEDPEDDEDEVADAVDHLPIIGLPLYGAYLSPLIMLGIMFYPFAEDVFPEEGEAIDGFETAAMTWAGDALIFHGEYDPDVVEDRYTENFAVGDERDEFTLYVGDGFADGMAYAVSNDTLIVGMEPGEEADYTPEAVVVDALDMRLDEVGRVIDDEDGEWLFNTTGDAQMAFGAWQTDDLGEALDPDEDEGDAEDDVDFEGNPVLDDVTSLVNNLVYDVEDGEMVNLEARFSALYPDESVPSEEEVVEYLIGEEDVPHDVVIDGNRVHATAMFEERPDDPTDA